ATVLRAGKLRRSLG
ncbi:MAG TPA: hypothetical protein DEG44_01035, partial [Candidatus Kerfeldbacteria bacterium]|nr:hypothetical protein [Candidatus Kerfeldbacteria bacterium]